MRPCKRVLLYCQDENVASVIAFTIRVYRPLGNTSQSYQAFVVSSIDAALAINNLYRPSSALVVRTTEGAYPVQVAKRLVRERIPTAFLNRHASPAEGVQAHINLGYDSKTADYLEAVRQLSAVKRGPKKKVAA